MTEENRNPESLDKEHLPGQNDSEEPIAEGAPIEISELINPEEKKTVTAFSAVIIGVVCAMVAFLLTWVITTAVYSNQLQKARTETGGLSNEAYIKLEQIKEILDKDFLYDIDEQSLTDMVLKGYMMGLGDPYADYYNNEEYSQLMNDANAEMQGIGISVSLNTELSAIQITGVFPDSPAQKAGVLPGDIIVRVKLDETMTDVAAIGYNAAVSALQGEAGSVVEFVVARGDDRSETVEFSIKREYITEYTVSHKVYSLDSTVGVITISSFDKKTPEQFKTAYDELLKKGCKKLVIDVRNNPGGELISVCTVLDMLVPEGPVARSVDKAGNEEVLYVSDKTETNIPLAVLVNENTASAGELFAACLKDYKKAVLVGETTFGKGIMQTVIGFTDGTAFKYTNRYYCPPFSENYNGVGVTPNVKAILSEEAESHFYTMTDEEDTQLQAAVKELNK